VSKSFIFLIFLLMLPAAPGDASGLDAELDRYETSIPIDQSTVINGTLHNSGKAAIFITGVQVHLSNSATAEVYNPALLQEQLRQLGPGQTWGGPLIVVTPKHRGPLQMRGSIVITGGKSPSVSDLLATIALRLSVDDPKRQPDGTFERWVVPVCNRSASACCEPSESLCVQAAGQCVYVADGFDKQQVCVNRQAAKTYESIADLRVSSDAAHVVYIARRHCSQAGPDELCERLLVADGVEHQASGAPTHLILSSDGKRYAYIGRQACIIHEDEEECSGSAHVVTAAHTSSPWEAVRGLRFSPDSQHVAYEAGKQCALAKTMTAPRELICRESIPIVDDHRVAVFPAWYVPDHESHGFTIRVRGPD
jgi:hypothetical protein